ncbi:transporter substrate-binding domain-containing protein [Candidatus Pantoea formicae]|uniref:transporter substrate-binding domain-containing protein n=1 Tax=Candidatus Pantoea formicae TaxID=2608355 RepID=UPI003EDA4D01
MYKSKMCCALLIATSLMATSAQAAIAKNDQVAALLPDAIKSSGSLRIAIPDIGKPLAYKENGELKGMDVELARAISDVMGVKADLHLVPFAAALTGLQANKYDVAYGEFYVTAERLKVADFVSNWQDYSSFLVAKAKDFRPKTLKEICGQKVGAMAGSAELETLKTAVAPCGDKKPTISAFASINQAILALNSSRVDGVLINRGGAQEAIHMDSKLDASGEIGGGPTATAVARNANSEKLLPAIKAAYDSLIQSGDYLKILQNNDTAYGAAQSAVIYQQNSTPPSYAFN